jgi:hypothetical protein
MLSKGSKVMAAVMVMVAGLCITNRAYSENKQERKLVVVASASAYEAAKKWVNFLLGETVPVKHVLPSDFEAYKKEKYLVILGTPSELGGAGEIITSLLTKDERDWVTQQGNRRLYTKTDVWQKDQTIFVCAAYSQDAIASALRESRDTWWEEIMSWFDIEMEPAVIRGY